MDNPFRLYDEDPQAVEAATNGFKKLLDEFVDNLHAYSAEWGYIGACDTDSRDAMIAYIRERGI